MRSVNNNWIDYNFNKQKSAKRGVNMVADFFVQRIFCRHSRKEKEDNSEILGII